MGNYLVNQYTKFKEPTITSMYYEKAIHMHKNGGEDYCLKMDRILDAKNQIYIGIGSHNPCQTLPGAKHPSELVVKRLHVPCAPCQNQMSLQVIRLGDYTNKYYRLLQFTEYENKLKYNFEDDVTLTLIKNQNGKGAESLCTTNSEGDRRSPDEFDIILTLSHLKEDKFISVKVDPIIVKHFKPINLASNEFDKIHDLFGKGIKTC